MTLDSFLYETDGALKPIVYETSKDQFRVFRIEGSLLTKPLLFKRINIALKTFDKIKLDNYFYTIPTETGLIYRNNMFPSDIIVSNASLDIFTVALLKELKRLRYIYHGNKHLSSKARKLLISIREML